MIGSSCFSHQENWNTKIIFVVPNLDGYRVRTVTGLDTIEWYTREMVKLTRSVLTNIQELYNLKNTQNQIFKGAHSQILSAQHPQLEPEFQMGLPHCEVTEPRLQTEPESLHCNFIVLQPKTHQPKSADLGQPQVFYCSADLLLFWCLNGTWALFKVWHQLWMMGTFENLFRSPDHVKQE